MSTELYKKGEVTVELVKEDIMITYAGKGGSVSVKIEGEYLLDKLAEAIPGEIDDTVINIIKAALKAD